jgi:hypothetical protein
LSRQVTSCAASGQRPEANIQVSSLQEVIEQMTELREIMRRNYENGVAEKIQQRWCSGDSGWLFRERWEKLFDDFVGIKQEKFDPSRVSWHRRLETGTSAILKMTLRQ